ncbi:MAG: hypothetical protein K8R59_04430 [Thermoanaerobaculales bacterium]|nr:hypothetical protein [Thermoanaerobaculales bacterium]
MAQVIAIRNETKNSWERRAPLTPDMIRHLVHDQELKVLVQPSSRRVYADNEFVRAGAEVKMDISEAGIVFGVKEVALDLLEQDTTYMFFSHVIKGQPHNIPLLSRIMELKCTLIDYETVRDENGRRLIFFGHFAGLAGMIDTLWALGQRFESRGIKTPFIRLNPAHTYSDLEEARETLQQIGKEIIENGLPAEIVPLTIGVAGYGNVARGAQEILAELPVHNIEPDALAELATSSGVSNHCIYRTTFRETDLVEPVDPGSVFELQDYYDHPEKYQSRFEPQLEHLTVIVNANYWDERYPRLVTLKRLQELFASPKKPRLEVIGDLGCDIGGNIECTLKCNDPGDPVYVWNPKTGDITSGVEGHGPAILAVDILPTELPRESSEEFSATLGPFAAAIARADYSVPFDELALPPEIKRAVIVHNGELTPEFVYLEKYLQRLTTPSVPMSMAGL